MEESAWSKLALRDEKLRAVEARLELLENELASKETCCLYLKEMSSGLQWGLFWGNLVPNRGTTEQKRCVYSNNVFVLCLPSLGFFRGARVLRHT